MSAKRKMQRALASKDVSATKAIQGLGQIGDLTSKIDHFVAAAEKMQTLAEKFDDVAELQSAVELARDAVAEVHARLDRIDRRNELVRGSITKILHYFKQFFTEDSTVSNTLEAIEKDLENEWV